MTWRTLGMAACFAAVLSAQSHTRGSIRGRLCYQLDTACKAPEDLIRPGEAIPEGLLPNVTVTRVDTGVPQPGGRADGRGEFQILELPVGKPVNLMACGKLIQQMEVRRYCGFATGTAKETREEETSPGLAHLLWKGAPPERVRPVQARLPAFRIILASLSSPPPTRSSVKATRRWVAIDDRSQLPVAGATILLVDLDSGAAAASCSTGKDGSCELTGATETEYALTIFAERFAPANFFVRIHADGAEVRPPDGDWRPSTALPLLPLPEAAERAAAATSLLSDLETTTRGSFDRSLVLKLPLGRNRSVDRLALLIPGVFPPPETWAQDGPSLAPGVGTAGQFSVNGLRSRENNFTVDGADNNDEDTGVRRQGFVALLPQPVNSLQEFQIITALPDARFGRTIGGQVNIVSEAGTARFHGSLYGFFADSRFSQRDPFDLDAGQYAASTRQFVPITTDGTLSGVPVQFDLSQPGSIRVVNGQGSQVNPSRGKNPFTQFRQGLVLGGPIRKTSTFASFAMERVSARASRETHFSVPTVRERGLLGSGDRGLTLLDDPLFVSPLFGATQQLGPTRPTTESGNMIFSLYPFPNNPYGPYDANTFTEILPADADGRIYSGRLDHHSRLFGYPSDLTLRVSHTSDYSVLPAVGGALFSALAPTWKTTSVASVISTNLTSRLANGFRFSFGTTRGDFDERRDSFLRPPVVFADEPFMLNAGLLRNLTIPGQPARYSDRPAPADSGSAADPSPALQVLGEVKIAGYSSVGVDAERFPYRRNQGTFQWADTLTWVHGRHTLYFGFDERMLRFDNWQERNRRPQIVFNGLRSAGSVAGANQQAGVSPLDLAAVGIPVGLFQSYGGNDDYSLGLHKTQVDLFFHDSWRLRPNLQFNVGFRLEFNRLPKGLDARLAKAYDPAFIQTATNAATARCLAIISSSSFCTSSLTSFLTVFGRDLSSVFAGDRVGNDPRIGVAWRPLPGHAAVLRVGAGVLTGQFPAIILNESRNTFPNFINLNAPRNAYATLAGKLGQIAPRFGATEAERVGAFIGEMLASVTDRTVVFNAVQPASRIKNPYSIQFSASISQPLSKSIVGRIAYVGNQAHKLLRITTPDGGLNRAYIASNFLSYRIRDVPDYISTSLSMSSGIRLTPYSTSPFLNRQFFEGTGNSSFHSLQADLSGTYRTRHLYRVAFTYGHAIDDVSDFFDIAASSALPQNSFARSERGSSSFDARRRIVAHWVGTLLEGRRHTRLGQWEIAAIGVLQSGRPYTVNSVYDWNADGNLTDRLDNTNGLMRSSGDPRRQLSLSPGVSTFDLLAPSEGQPGRTRLRDGAVGRNTFVSRGLSNLDVALMQTWKLRERFSVGLRTEVYNVSNREQYGTPVRFVEAPGFGRSVTTIASPRNVQFALEINF